MAVYAAPIVIFIPWYQMYTRTNRVTVMRLPEALLIPQPADGQS